MTAVLTFDFNDAEARDDHGRWTDGGGEGDSPATKAAKTIADNYHPGGDRAGMGDVKISPEDAEALRAPGTTSAPYMRPDGTFTPERQALHDEIVRQVTSGVPSVAHPTLYMTGGGPAAGKSEMLGAGDIDLPDRYVHNDPDALKGMLPEVQDMQHAGNPDWARLSHEESSYLSKRVTAAAYENHQDLVLDSTGDSSLRSLTGKIDKAHAAGYTVEGDYISRDPEAAVQAALERGVKTGRFVPESVIRNTYENLRTVVPASVDKFDVFRLYDNNGPKGSAFLAAEKPSGGSLTIHDQAAWDRFKNGHA